MQIPIYKFILDGFEVHPVYNELSKKYEKESETQIFKESIEGTIKLVKDTFDYIASQSLDHKFEFTIQMLVNGSYTTYFNSTFFKTNCTFDYDKKICTPKLTQVNTAIDLYNKRDNTVDLLKMKVPITPISIAKRSTLQIYCAGSGTLACITANGSYWEEEVIESISDQEQLENTYFFNLSKWIGTVTFKKGGVRPPENPDIDVTGTYLCSLNYRPENPNKTKLTYTRIDGLYKAIVYLEDHEEGGLPWSEMEGQIMDISGNVLFECKSDFASEKWEYVGDPSLSHMPIGLTFISTLGESIYTRMLSDLSKIGDNTGQKIPYDGDICTNRSGYKYAYPFVTSSLYISDDIRDEPNIYGVTSGGKYYYPPYNPTMDFRPINKSNWGDSYSVWLNFSIEIQGTLEKAVLQYTLKDAYKLSDIIQAILTEYGFDISFSDTAEYSTFLYGDNPIRTQAFELFISPKSNVLKGQYDKPAQKAEITFESIMDMLMNCFRCYWFVDSSNRLRIEHITWFMRGETYEINSNKKIIDLTAKHDKFNNMTAGYFQNSVEYDTSELASRYEFNWMDDVTDFFEGSPLIITSEYVDQSSTEDISIQDFTTDIDYMLANPEAFSSDGFALIGASKDSNETYYIPILNHYQNYYLSWPSLISSYYIYDLPGYSIKYEATSMYAAGLKQFIKQDVEFISYEDPDTLSLIKTELGSGTIDSMSINLNTRKISASIYFS